MKTKIITFMLLAALTAQAQFKTATNGTAFPIANSVPTNAFFILNQFGTNKNISATNMLPFLNAIAAVQVQNAHRMLTNVANTNGYTLPISWTNIANLPAGFADNTDDGGGGAQTNISVAGVTNAGTAAYSNSAAFYLASNPSGFVDGTGHQPLDADLTSIAAIATTAFGRSLLDETDAASTRTTIGAGTSSFDGVFASLTSKPTTIGGYAITDFNSLGDARWQLVDTDLTTIAGLTATTDNFVIANASAWASRTPAQAKTSLALVKADVGLGSVDNVADVSKPVSSAQQSALDGKQTLDSDLTSIAALTTTGFGRGLLDDADGAAARTTIGAVIGTDVQAFDADLTDLADGTLTGSKVGTGIDAANITAGVIGVDRIASGSALQVVRRNAANTALEFTTLAGGGDALVANPLSQFAATTSAQLAGVISDETGTGAVVLADAPALTGNPTAPTQAVGNNSTRIATTAFVTAAASYGVYETVMTAVGSHIAARVAGTYFIPTSGALGITGTGTLYPPALIHIVGADYPTVNGVSAKLRIRVVCAVNDTAPTGNFTIGLYPVTRPGTSGGAGLNIYTLGTVVSGSNGATFTAPAADSLGTAVSADFAIPADGVYVIGVVTTATVATASHMHFSASLQTHYN